MMESKRVRNILIVDDSEDDFETVERALKKLEYKEKIHRCVSGQDALDYLYAEGKYQENQAVTTPDLLFLDLNMPGMDGKEILRKLRQDPEYKKLPVIIFTNSDYPKDIEECYQLGANSYVKKPVTFEGFKESIKNTVDYWFNSALIP